jgi:hypothetical protein
MQAPRVEVGATIKLTEAELRALEALAGYGDDGFLKVFYEHLGKAYLKPHKAGLKSLFAVIRADLRPIMARADAAKKAFALRDPVIRSREEHDNLIKRLTEQKEKP